MKKCLLCVLLMVWLAACNQKPPQPTAVPDRPSSYETVHITRSGSQLLSVSLDQFTLLATEAEPDTQVIAVLSNGNNEPAYVMYPSNQPGVPQTEFALTAYPLQIESNARQPLLWVLALRHQAYPVADKVGMVELSYQLANGFNELLKRGDTGVSTVAEIAADGNTALRRWFGEIEVLGELTLPVELVNGSYTTTSPDGGFELHYSIQTNASTAMISAPPAVTEEATAESTALADEYPGYKLVIDDDFTNAESDVDWFRGRNDYYRATIVEGAYQIALIGIEDGAEEPLSWGSIQELVFDDYIVRAKMRVLERGVLTRYGLWLHYLDGFNFVFFGIETTGKYRIASLERRYTELVNWTADASINLGTASNVMEVRVEGNTFTMWINGTMVVTTTDDTFDKGRIAFFCYAETYPATCQLQEMQVWIPEDAPFPPPTATPTLTP